MTDPDVTDLNFRLSGRINQHGQIDGHADQNAHLQAHQCAE